MDTTTIAHWRAGQRWAGSGERFGDVYDPATGRVARQVAFASGADVDAIVADAVVAGREWAAASLSRRTSGALRVPRGAAPAHAATWRPRSPPSTARCSTTRWARCSAASRSSSSRAVPRTCSRAASATASPPVSTSTRSGSRSAWSPSSRRSTSRPWCRCGSCPSRSRAATRSCSSRARRTRRRRCSWPSCGPRPACRRACSAWCTATRWPSTRCSSTRT